MALDAGLNLNPTSHCHVHGVLLPRIATLVSLVSTLTAALLDADGSARYMEKAKYDKAFKALRRLRSHDIQAARDMYYAFKLLEIEKAEREGKSLWKELFAEDATLGSL